MCSSPSPPAATTPAPAPAPAAPAPAETQVGLSRRNANTAQYGSADGPATRVNRDPSVSIPGGGSGLNM